ncbi:MAG: hypothetical protein N4A48_06885 [Tepidibacter sp.]|jgi:hypothetical protein|uniref:hypothetical protein n=1 Tax=Tepidibacter sp. TaxID=2529387 RepID=UPI0025F81CBB|nr:hypothetical protein [Tepidibacter sp.]MCT4508474.1 hypothetical protein [Tepidibacter sp.]
MLEKRLILKRESLYKKNYIPDKMEVFKIDLDYKKEKFYDELALLLGKIYITKEGDVL